jgi:hypothetical protein
MKPSRSAYTKVASSRTYQSRRGPSRGKETSRRQPRRSSRYSEEYDDNFSECDSDDGVSATSLEAGYCDPNPTRRSRCAESGRRVRSGPRSGERAMNAADTDDLDYYDAQQAARDSARRKAQCCACYLAGCGIIVFYFWSKWSARLSGKPSEEGESTLVPLEIQSLYSQLLSSPSPPLRIEAETVATASTDFTQEMEQELTAHFKPPPPPPIPPRPPPSPRPLPPPPSPSQPPPLCVTLAQLEYLSAQQPPRACSSLGRDQQACEGAYALQPSGSYARCIFTTEVGSCEASAKQIACPSPPPPPMHPPPPPPPPGGPPTSNAAIINARFHRKPYTGWDSTGILPDSGVLIHCFDGYEDHSKNWYPVVDISSSLIYDGTSFKGAVIPTFTCLKGGLILRPGTSTKIKCAAGQDNGGVCKGFCHTLNAFKDWPGDDCHGLNWPPENIGKYLELTAAYSIANKRSTYNEFIVDPLPWQRNVPQTVEAMFGTRGAPLKEAGVVHRAFLREFGLSKTSHPLLLFNDRNWDTPFSDA